MDRKTKTKVTEDTKLLIVQITDNKELELFSIIQAR